MADRCAVEAEARRCAIAERDGVPFNAVVEPSEEAMSAARWTMDRSACTVYSYLSVLPDGSVVDPAEVLVSPDDPWRARRHAELRAVEHARETGGAGFLVVHTWGRRSRAHCHVALRVR
jgi:hypothetical protein